MTIWKLGPIKKKLHVISQRYEKYNDLKKIRQWCYRKNVGRFNWFPKNILDTKLFEIWILAILYNQQNFI